MHMYTILHACTCLNLHRQLSLMFIGVVSHVGHMPTSTDENWSRLFTIGPMSRYAEDLAPMLKVLANKNADKLRLDEAVRINSVICTLRYGLCLNLLKPAGYVMHQLV